MISTNSGFNEAPPTRKPSTSGCVAKRKSQSLLLNVFHHGRTKLLAVCSGNTASIDNPGVLCYSRRHCFREELADILMSLLGLSRRSDFTRANRPHRLVSDHNIAGTFSIKASQRNCKFAPPVTLLQHIDGGLQLLLNDCCSLPSFTLLKGLADAKDDFQARV